MFRMPKMCELCREEFSLIFRVNLGHINEKKIPMLHNIAHCQKIELTKMIALR